ncbi:FKBP-type peptidyl-prolyl cis-trans isomerase [Aurantiacibacter gangjinensis]|uniref:Peptidyl-prolyl cis-trans isomerase n=1 Tax=Aurantiacibacter gangjinensis TaxID=502682 RepID=A0A0G9MS09_9SPHN|nr:FKBP-type peptidyl-prolyl cis-trans isomerase [Aurantiacibacter gangjinensis]APE27094.1 putative peptidyl-prolyl isomerase [Aurantiacibacter gangjinensis]KLE33512.1 peptidylprolyl isomerase [Aurantiacibacter gangjinensis]
MAEVTRVPLQPIAKGSLAKLWLGVLAAVVLAALIAWVAMPKGLSVETITAGEGPAPTEDSVVFVEYVGTLDDGTEFDRSPPTLQLPPQIADLVPEGVPMELGSVVDGFRDGLLQTREGGEYEIYIPADLAYGDSPPPGSDIGPGADLTFNVTVHDVLTQEEFQQLSMQIQMLMMQEQMEAGPADPAAPQ